MLVTWQAVQSSISILSKILQVSSLKESCPINFSVLCLFITASCSLTNLASFLWLTNEIITMSQNIYQILPLTTLSRLCHSLPHLNLELWKLEVKAVFRFLYLCVFFFFHIQNEIHWPTTSMKNQIWLYYLKMDCFILGRQFSMGFLNGQPFLYPTLTSTSSVCCISIALTSNDYSGWTAPSS